MNADIASLMAITVEAGYHDVVGHAAGRERVAYVLKSLSLFLHFCHYFPKFSLSFSSFLLYFCLLTVRFFLPLKLGISSFSLSVCLFLSFSSSTALFSYVFFFSFLYGSI